MAPDLEPLFAWIAGHTIVLTIIVTARQPGRANAWLLTAFIVSSISYFAFKLGYLSPDSVSARLVLSPLLASETLAGSLLALYVFTTLYKTPRLVFLCFLGLPLVEAAIIWLSLLSVGETATAHLAQIFIPAGQLYILCVGVGTIWLLLQHFRAYESELADNRRRVFHLLIAPSSAVFVLNLTWIIHYFGADIPASILATRNVILFMAIILQGWLIAYLLYGNMAAHGLPFPHTIRRPFLTHPAAKDGINADPRSSQDFIRVKKLLEDERLYLDADLSLERLARHIGLNRSRLSAAINADGATNFSGLINSLRVDYAKELLSKTELSVIKIAFESGFNSKSTFNRVFKDMVGLTPRNWRAFKQSQ